jgi:hypothetical protein
VSNKQLFSELSGDPSEAFVTLEASLRTKLNRTSPQSRNREPIEREYVETLWAFLCIHPIDLGQDVSYDPRDEAFEEFFERFRFLAGTAAARITLEKHGPKGWVAYGLYELTASEKAEIRGHIEKIKELIAEADISQGKRDALINRLNIFAAEVERDRTRAAALHSLYVFCRDQVDDEIDKQIDRIFDVLNKAKEFVGLAKPEEQKRLPPPLTTKKLSKNKTTKK